MSKIMSGRMGEDTEAIRRRWPFPDPPLKKINDIGFKLDEKLRVFAEAKKKMKFNPDEKLYGGMKAGGMSELKFNPMEHEQMK